MLFPCLIRRLVALIGAGLAALLIVGGLAACSPIFDWRDVLPEQAPFVVALPGRPAEMSRDINLDGIPVKMQMVGARAGGLAFTAAWAQVSAPDEASADNEPLAADGQQSVVQKALAAMQTGMVNNIAGQIVTQETRNIALLGPQGGKAGLLPAVFIDASGKAGGQDVRMQAVFAALGNDLMQFVVLGDPFSPEAAAIFFESVRGRVRAGQVS